MFEEEDDFEIDEEFLVGVFDAEKTANEKLDSCAVIASKSELEAVNELPPKKNQLIEENIPAKLSEEGLTPLKKRRINEESTFSKSFEKTLQGGSNLSTISLSSQGYQGSSGSRAGATTETFKFRSHLGDRCQPKTITKFCDSSARVVSESVLNPAEVNLHSPLPHAMRVCQRKFPGPAGLLPDRQRSFRNSNCEIPDEAEDTGVPLCSQSALSVLEDGPWTTLQADFAHEGQRLLEHYTIAWIKKKAAGKQLHGQKVPFLAAVVHSLDCSSPDPCVVFRDATGEIPGTLHRSVWESFGGQLVVGSALVLRLVGVLSTGISARRHYLNITDNNIVTIYCATLDEAYLKIDTRSRGVRKTDVHKWTLNQLLQTVNNWEDQSRNKNTRKIYSSANYNNTAVFSKPTSVDNVSRSKQSLTNLPPITNTSVHTPIRPKEVFRFHPSGQVNNLIPNLTSNSGLFKQPSKPSHFTDLDNVESSLCTSAGFKQCQNLGDKPQSRFVPKKPLMSVQLKQKDTTSQQNESALLSNTSSRHCTKSVASENAIHSLSDLEDLDLSSVLDGIDSDSLFGEF